MERGDKQLLGLSTVAVGLLLADIPAWAVASGDLGSP